MRNVARPSRALEEAHRVLRRGGRFLMLEFGWIENPLLEKIYDSYSFSVIPQLGQIVSGNRAAYQYLVESIRRFPPQPEFSEMIRQANFQAVSYTNLSFGIAAVYSGFKL
mmetsp:Transcript_13109/g.26592  ORF Transcript_13109/g.26592 Transcript_13109/m.26592 type:complete len:110 (-) Transcript_13109:2205-2534(-)